MYLISLVCPNAVSSFKDKTIHEKNIFKVKLACMFSGELIRVVPE